MRRPYVLVIDDDEAIAAVLRSLLTRAGFDVATAPDGDAALARVREAPTELALLDLNLGHESGLELLPRLKTLRPEMSVIAVTALGAIETVVEAMQLGADNYVVKPIDPERLIALMRKGLEARTLRQAKQQLDRLRLRPTVCLDDSPSLAPTIALTETVAKRDTTVLLTGETGTGKGVVAQLIHQRSPRAQGPFVELNCAGLQRDLTESELFGYERGAFTGAVGRKLGLFEAADGGTLFLDEIGEMDPAVQAKLLKVLESRRFRRVGGVVEIEVDVRLIAATHQDLPSLVTRGSFRRDLFYRLNVFTIPLPPLRERRRDIVPLARRMLVEHGATGELTRAAEARLVEYAWPGNVRELRNVVERAAILCSAGPIDVVHLPLLAPGPQLADAPSAESFDDLERNFIAATLARIGDVHAAAKALGISRATLYRKLKKHALTAQD